MDDVILALSFGKPEDIAPNRTIARLARQLSDGGEIPIVADNSVPMDTSISVSYIGAEAETHVSTLKLMEEFVGLLKEKRWHRIVIVSEPSYLIRCERDLKKVLGKNAWKYQIPSMCTVTVATAGLTKIPPSGGSGRADFSVCARWSSSCCHFGSTNLSPDNQENAKGLTEFLPGLLKFLKNF